MLLLKFLWDLRDNNKSVFYCAYNLLDEFPEKKLVEIATNGTDFDLTYKAVNLIKDKCDKKNF